MKKLVTFLISFSLVCVVSSCQKTNETPLPGTVNNDDWLVPLGEVRDGGPGKDGIPSVDHPNFASPSAINFLSDTDLVLGFKIGNDVRAYPHPVLDWHEIINDKIEGKQIAITYCPLTGTGIGWNRIVDNKLTTFGVSGLLYNSNIIPYDRATDSNWSQMRLECVNGPLLGKKPETYQMLETNWATWKNLFPNSQVVTANTGFSRDYNRYPYGSYKTNQSLLFPVSHNDSRLHPKERVLGIISNGKAKAYPFDPFTTPGVIEDTFDGLKVVVIGSKPDNYLIAFEKPTPELSFTAFSNPADPTVVIKDNEGNEWNVFGEAVSGPRIGEALGPLESFIGYWFSWGAFYPGIEIYE